MHARVCGTVLGAALVAIGCSAPAAAPAHGGISFDCSALTAPVEAATPTMSVPVTGAAPTFPPGEATLTVFAAAALTDAFTELELELETAYPGLDIVYNFGGSQALVTQLSEGAAADVFASANLPQMTAAQDNGSIAGEAVVFARNQLAIVVPASNPAGIDDSADLGNDGLRLVLAQPEVPVGRYSRESVCLMARDAATYGEGFAERVAANVVSEEEDVRDVLAKVELGEADAGIVYVSDARAGGEAVTAIAIPEAVNLVAVFPIAAAAGGDEELADAFIGSVLGPDGQAALAAAGFEAVAPVVDDASPAP
jgi:molybdate transport system substrate-binding protein